MWASTSSQSLLSLADVSCGYHPTPPDPNETILLLKNRYAPPEMDLTEVYRPVVECRTSCSRTPVLSQGDPPCFFPLPLSGQALDEKSVEERAAEKNQRMMSGQM